MIKVMLVDDDKLSMEILKKLLLDSQMVDIVGCFQKSGEALEFIKDNPIDAAFLDIEMPNMNGFELANIVSQKHIKCAIVFLTAHDQYAVEAFGINALDYLLKPVKKERLEETLDRIANQAPVAILSSEIKIECFGKFKIMAADTEIKFRTKKAEELLALLVDRKGKSISRSKIIDSLWADFEGDKALINFNTTLYYTRKAFQQHGIELPIVCEEGSYRIETSGIQCDYLLFEQCDLSDVKLDKNNVAYYEKIAQLYTGDYLEANDYFWSQSNQLNIKEDYIRLLLVLSEYYKQEGQNTKIIEWMKKGFALEPLNKKVIENLVEILTLEGNYSLAANYYKLHKETLKSLFNKEPEEKLKKLMVRQ
jgi:two-component SAPR family response regulator